MTSARDLAALSGHTEADCERVLGECHGDVERAIDKLLNSAYDRTARERGARVANAAHGVGQIRGDRKAFWRLTIHDSRGGGGLG